MGANGGGMMVHGMEVGNDSRENRDGDSSREKKEENDRKGTSFGTQAKALFRKNAAQQRRSPCQNVFIVMTPIFFCLLLFVLQTLIDSAFDTRDNRCGCLCLRCCDEVDGVKTCRDYNSTVGNACLVYDTCEEYDETQCGFEYSSASQASFCAVESPSIWPAVAQVPSPGYLAHPWSPDGALLVSGEDSVVESLDLFPVPDITPQSVDAMREFAAKGQQNDAVYAGSLSLLGVTLGTFQKFPNYNYFVEPAFSPTSDYNGSLSLLTSNASAPETQAAVQQVESLLQLASSNDGVQGLTVSPLQMEIVKMNSTEQINEYLYCGYKEARCDSRSDTNAYTNALDFTGTDFENGKYSMTFWYNSTGRFPANGNAPTNIVRVQAIMNAATNAFLRNSGGPNIQTKLVGVMQMPKPASTLRLDIASLVGTLFYTWLLQLLLPVMLSTLVSEKEGRLRNMMKMHGLGDTAYWSIQYIWYFIINTVYVWILIGIGTAIDLAFFKFTSYSFQLVFYLLWVSCLVATTFLMSTWFRSAKTSVVVSFLYVFGTGLIGYLLLSQFLSAGYWWVIFFELIPGFALYRGMYEIGQFAFRAAYGGNSGINWSNLNSDGNGIVAVMIIFAVESVLFLVLAWYIEQVYPQGCGVPRHPLFFLGKKFKSEIGENDTDLSINNEKDGSVPISMEPKDVAKERANVEAILKSSDFSDKSMIIKHLKKVFPGKVKKMAVKDLTLAISKGECFGLLGPNGAGKSTSLNMLTGFLSPSGGSAMVEGYDITTDIEQVYHIMGVCPQDNLLWEDLSAREHLLFYARLKNLQGEELQIAVEKGLQSVNLHGDVSNKKVKTFSGGMKRRLSVAISLIGSPAVVYLDEPSTGLDPASRQTLWRVVKEAKPNRGIILTTHSMAEASVLCDRLGIFVDGELVCIGAPKELTARYGDYFVFTITTAPEDTKCVDEAVHQLCPTATRTYALAGTQRYELPCSDVTLHAVFDAVDDMKKSTTVLDWGVSNATLEEVFIKFAKEKGLQGGN